MKYRYRSRRSIKRLARKSRRNFIITLAIIGSLIYVTVNWVLPNFIGYISYISDIIKPPKKIVQAPSSEILAPPVLNIPYEATNTAQIQIAGYGTPGSKVKIYLDDEAKDIQDVSSDGTFLFTGISLKLGTNNIYGKTVDEKGDESLPSKTLRLVYIHDKPQLTVNEPEDGKKIQGGDKKVRISGKTDSGIKVIINDSQVIVGADGSFNFDLPLNEGDNIISIKAQDAAGNTNEIQRIVEFTP